MIARIWTWYDGNTTRRRTINIVAAAFAAVLILTQIA